MGATAEAMVVYHSTGASTNAAAKEKYIMGFPRARDGHLEVLLDHSPPACVPDLAVPPVVLRFENRPSGSGAGPGPLPFRQHMIGIPAYACKSLDTGRMAALSEVCCLGH